MNETITYETDDSLDDCIRPNSRISKLNHNCNDISGWLSPAGNPSLQTANKSVVTDSADLRVPIRTTHMAMIMTLIGHITGSHAFDSELYTDSRMTEPSSTGWIV
jgi:hypothetical protein